MPNFAVSLKDKNDVEYCKSILKQYAEQNNYPTQGDALLSFFKMVDQGEDAEVISYSEKERRQVRYEELKDVCDRGLMSIIGDIPVCGQHTFPKGIQSQQYFTYPRGHSLEKQTMSNDDIIKTCELCKQSFSEDSRIKDIMKKMSMMLSKDQKIELFFCKHPDLSEMLFTAFREATFICAINNRYVTVDKTCLIKSCPHLILHHIDAPPMKQEGDK